jgi:hypothetical protein
MRDFKGLRQTEAADFLCGIGVLRGLLFTEKAERAQRRIHLGMNFKSVLYFGI